MRIQHNIMAMNAYRNYNTNNSALSKNLEKLSSGYAINRAGDDAAGLAISEKMRAQITGLNTAQDNAQSGINLVQTAEGAMTEVHDMLNRMYELANQSANGTYDEIDREQLNKEVDALKEEINRIADSTNFNGIDLLDGNLAKADGVTLSGMSIDAASTSLSGEMGTVDTSVDGVLSKGRAEEKYSVSFYFGELDNSATTDDKTIKFTYKDNNGADKDVTITVKGGQKITADDIVNALNGGTGHTSTAVHSVTDSGTAISATDHGVFNELYKAEVSGDMIKITAKNENGETVNGGTIDSTKANTVSMSNTLVAADVTAAEKALNEKYDGNTTNTIKFGAVGQSTSYSAKVDTTYQVASTKLKITAADAAKAHNMAITVGDFTYILRDSSQKLSDDTPADGKTVKYVTLDATTDNTAGAIASKLAAAITANEKTNGGYIASVVGDELTISESVNRGNEVIDGTKSAGVGAGIVKFEKYVLSQSGEKLNGTVKFDSSEFANGTTLTIGDKTYLLTNDPTIKKSGTTQVKFAEGATSEDIANALRDQLISDGYDASTITATSNGELTFTGTEFLDGTVNKSAITAVGKGLTLQIGDTSDSFNQLNVVVQDMHAASLGIENIDISTQDGAKEATDLIKAAINVVSDVRGTLGASQNRLEHTINSLSVTEENITSSESSIRDTDVAEEMMAYTKNNILIQSAQAMLAQANQVPQGVLQLLG